MYEQDNSSANEPWIQLVLLLFAPLMLILAPIWFIGQVFGFWRNGGEER